MIGAALFDLDGTLLDSRGAVLAAYRLAAAEYPGGAERLAAIPVGSLLAMRVAECCAAIAGPERGAECAEKYDVYYRTRTRDEVRLYPGVVAVLADLRAHGIRLGVVTNKGASRTPADIAPLDGRGHGAALFDVVITAADSVERKPSPRPIEIALERTGWKPADAVYVGDGPHDAEAAFGAGLAFVGAGWGYYGAAALDAAGATVICDEVSALPAAIRGA
ncbi:HAD family hydrolase [Cryptosporangium arvum]|uniref:HAD family hydrolase n=1 Tax=Cryptosporangium arvum TaxID=80871 RepID=UPI0004B04939|nr:HAD family hydrolase [Cryptosporangium arvum]